MNCSLCNESIILSDVTLNSINTAHMVNNKYYCVACSDIQLFADDMVSDKNLKDPKKENLKDSKKENLKDTKKSEVINKCTITFRCPKCKICYNGDACPDCKMPSPLSRGRK